MGLGVPQSVSEGRVGLAAMPSEVPSAAIGPATPSLVRRQAALLLHDDERLR